MSVPADRMDPAKRLGEQTLAQSHAVAQQAAGAHSAALSKMHAQITNAPDGGGQMQMLQAIHGMLSGGGAPGGPQGPGDSEGPGDLPDPETLVQQDPQAAMSYAEAIMAAIAHLLMNSASAPSGAPEPDDQAAGPAVGGGEGPAY